MSFKLTPTEAQQKWVEALRSGEYQQCRTQLCLLGADEKPSGYCCLGVACELYRQYEGGLRVVDQVDGGYRRYDNNSAMLPEKVRRWLGLQTDNGFFGVSPDGVTLAGKNDAGASFAEIADIIESRPSGLFV